jgi:hypothetical protein
MRPNVIYCSPLSTDPAERSVTSHKTVAGFSPDCWSMFIYCRRRLPRWTILPSLFTLTLALIAIWVLPSTFYFKTRCQTVTRFINCYSWALPPSPGWFYPNSTQRKQSLSQTAMTTLSVDTQGAATASYGCPAAPYDGAVFPVVADWYASLPGWSAALDQASTPTTASSA